METPVDSGVGRQQAVQQQERRKSRADRQEGQFDLTKQRRPGESAIAVVLFICGIISIFTTIGIVFVLADESLLFFTDSRAWTRATAPVLEDEQPDAELVESIGADQQTFPLAFDASRIPFTSRQFIQVGDETMRIEDRHTDSDPVTITVERGADGTEAVSHDANATILSMREEQIRITSEINSETNFLPLPEDFSREFVVGDNVRLDLEVMEVTEVQPDGLVVDRGLRDTTLTEHDADTVVELADVPTLGEFLTRTQWQPQNGDFGVWPLLLSTLIISTIALIVSIPLGLGAAIYLSEYASPRVRGILKPMLEILAGIPTVVFGFFALTFVTPALGLVFQQIQFYNMLSAGLVVGFLLIPYISSLSEDALRAVPMALRQASYGLGATRLETTVRVILPAALSGILASIIIATSRAVGETMIVAIAAGSGPNFTFNIFEGAETMTGHIARISSGDISYNSIDYNSIFAIGALLFIVTLALNLLSLFVSRRFREDY